MKSLFEPVLVIFLCMLTVMAGAYHLYRDEGNSVRVSIQRAMAWVSAFMVFVIF